MVANGVPGRAHLVAVATRSRVGQARSAGHRARLGVQDSKPVRRRRAMIGPLDVVFLTLDLTDEEPEGVLILNGPVEVWTRQRDMREDALVHCPLHQTLAAVAPLRDHGLPPGPDALQTIYG